MIKKTYPDNTSQTFAYDAKGNIAAANKNISYAFAYDQNNRITSVTDSNNRTIKYEYNSLGSKTKMITPEGKAISYAYDDGNRLSKMSAQGFEHETLNWSFAYDTAGRRTKLTYPNKATANYIYDSAGRLTSLYHKTSKGHVIDSFNYTLDKVGNRLTKSGMHENISYAYDAIYRLKEAIGHHHHGSEEYTYDPMGNRLSGPMSSMTYTYNQVNQLLDKNIQEHHEKDKNTEYGYDKNGNLIKMIEHKNHNGRHDEITLYSYDYENRLIKVEIQMHHHRQTVTFAYDPFGRRIEKTVSGTSFPHWGEDWREWFDKDDRDKNDRHRTRSTTYVYDNQDILMEYDHHGRVQARYIHGLGIDEHLAIEKKADVYYYHADGLGSITALTDKKQHVVQRYKYDSFGNIIREREKIEQPYAFTGREWDEETGLYEYRARYYDSKTGRFNLQKDPIGINGGVNLYAYVGNNPVNFVDPFGLQQSNPTGSCPPQKSCQQQAQEAYDNCMAGMSKGVGGMSTAQCLGTTAAVSIGTGFFFSPPAGVFFATLGTGYCSGKLIPSPDVAQNTGEGYCSMLKTRILNSCQAAQ